MVTLVTVRKKIRSNPRNFPKPQKEINKKSQNLFKNSIEKKFKIRIKIFVSSSPNKTQNAILIVMLLKEIAAAIRTEDKQMNRNHCG